MSAELKQQISVRQASEQITIRSGTEQWSTQTEVLTESHLKFHYFYFKRLTDWIVAAVALIILLPLILIIAVLIKWDSPGPVFFSQERVGARRRTLNGQTTWEIRTFTFYKFRTMRVDIDPALHRQFMQAYIAGNEAMMAALQPDPEAATAFKLTGDPRITRVGGFLRKFSLDELPQLWNVMKGDMSLVGPRPPIPYEVDLYQVKHFQRFAALPGITGLWQVSGRCATSFDEMIHLDVEYIEKQSIWLDLKILLWTVPAIISQEGAG